MGIRIHKAVGYGVVDASIVGINIGKLYLEHQAIRNWSPKQFWGWAADNTDHLPPTPYNQDVSEEVKLSLAMSDNKGTLANCCCLGRGDDEDDTGDSRFLLLTLPQASDWYRWDDTIDYLEASYPSGGRLVVGASPTRAEPLVGCNGIFPYSGMFHRLRPPPPGCPKPPSFVAGYASALDSEGWPTRMDPGEYNRLVGRWDKGATAMVKGEYLTHLMVDWGAQLPWPIAVLATKLGLTLEQQALLQPMRATWWV